MPVSFIAMNARSRHDQLVALLIAALLLLGVPACLAAKAPISDAERKKQASHIVTGEVVSVTSKVQKSTIETGQGMHRDKVFSIRVRVKEISKGKDLESGDEILVLAWQPHTRVPPLPGLQGHTTIPKKGARATFYLKKDGQSYAPLLPNGIDVEKNP